MRKRILTAFNEAIYDTDRVRALEVIHRALADGVTPEEVIIEVIIPGIELMMTSGEDGFEANLAQHFMAAQIAAEVTDELVPRFRRRPEITGRVVIGTAWGDFHGLGKRIVIGCLKVHLIEVIDLGLNVYNRGLTCGVINDIPLIDWRPEQVRAEVKRLLADGMPGGRFLFGTLVMPLAIPEDNIRAMVDAACEFGSLG
jgi:methanogenic corrinoid protein MtbC1